MRENRRFIVDRENHLSMGGNRPEYLMKLRNEPWRCHTASGIACYTEGSAYAKGLRQKHA